MIELYIHIPFCKSKCRYCDFCSFRAEEGTIHAYLGKLKEELIFWGKKLAARDVCNRLLLEAERHHILEEKIFK